MSQKTTSVFDTLMPASAAILDELVTVQSSRPAGLSLVLTRAALNDMLDEGDLEHARSLALHLARLCSRKLHQNQQTQTQP